MGRLPSSGWIERRKVVLLRGLLVVAVGGLLVDADVSSAGPGALALVVVFALSDALLAAAPLRYVRALRLELALGVADLVLVGLGIHVAGAGSGALPVSCLLMVLVVALGSHRSHAAAGAAAVGALHSWLVLGASTGVGTGRQLVLQVLFLCSVGLYYGVLTEGIHRLRRTREAESLGRKELEALLDILGAATSSLDLREVTGVIVRKLTTVVPALRCSIVYIDESTNRCFVTASHDDPDLDMLELDLQKYPEIAHAIRTREPVVLRDILNDPVMASVRSRLKGLEFQSVLVIPLLFGEDVLGTLCLRAARARTEFSNREIEFCTAVARACANALKNSVLHQQAQEESAGHKATGQKLSRILEHSPEAIVATDGEGRITEFNHGAEGLLGYRRQELLGRPARDLLAETEKDMAARTVSPGAYSGRNCRFRTRDGAELGLELLRTVLRDESGSDAGELWIGRDVTELMTARKQLAQAEKLSSIGEVISGVAHELNNPLTGVLGYSQLLLARHRDGPMAGQLEKIGESARRCQKIVKNLLSFARGNKSERKRLGINGIIEKTLDLKKYQLRVNSVEVVRDLAPDVPLTMLDFHQMQQVLLNLVNNSEHAMGEVRDRPGRLEITSSHENGTIRVEVTDNGRGMSEETLGRIFEPFYTTKEQGKGTGLGLSVSYGIVKEHGGSIRAVSREGRGTTFVIELPVLRDEERQAGDGDVSASTEARTAAGGVILVVDDEPTIQDLLIDILEDLGHRVDTAANGAEAARKLVSRDYDLVITDVRMPQMNGMDLYRNILSTRPELKRKVVFVTGDLGDTGTVEFLAEVGAPTIAKPLEIQTVVEIVQEMIA